MELVVARHLKLCSIVFFVGASLDCVTTISLIFRVKLANWHVCASFTSRITDWQFCHRKLVILTVTMNGCVLRIENRFFFCNSLQVFSTCKPINQYWKWKKMNGSSRLPNSICWVSVMSSNTLKLKHTECKPPDHFFQPYAVWSIKMLFVVIPQNVQSSHGGGASWQTTTKGRQEQEGFQNPFLTLKNWFNFCQLPFVHYFVVLTNYLLTI